MTNLDGIYEAIMQYENATGDKAHRLLMHPDVLAGLVKDVEDSDLLVFPNAKKQPNQVWGVQIEVRDYAPKQSLYVLGKHSWEQFLENEKRAV